MGLLSPCLGGRGEGHQGKERPTIRIRGVAPSPVGPPCPPRPPWSIPIPLVSATFASSVSE